MMLTWFDRIGNWNPQLFRELKGRLKSRPTLLMLVGSLFLQAVLLKVFWDQLPSAYYGRTSYCLLSEQYECLLSAAGQPLADWQRWWTDLFRTLNWLIPFALIVPAVYFLIADLVQEEQRGTFNFIRLSPQSDRSILLGKWLGVPILVYLAIATAIPLHLVSAMGAQAPFGFIISFYVLLAASYGLFSSTAFLFAFLAKSTANNNQLGPSVALLFCLLSIIVMVPAHMVWNSVTSWAPFVAYTIATPDEVDPSFSWFFLSLSGNQAIAHVFTLSNIGLISYGIWQALKRCFYSPSATILSKSQSYWVVPYLQILVLGFIQGNWSPNFGQEDFSATLIFLCTLNLLIFLGLAAALSPHRQTLLDWSRYRMSERTPDLTRRPRSLKRDLLFGEKSPSSAAIAINLIMAVVILTLWTLGWPSETERGVALLGLVLSFNLIAIYAILIQLMLMLKTRQRALVSGSAISGLILVPLIVAYALSGGAFTGTSAAQILLFSPFLWIPLQEISAFTFLAILAQWGILALLSLQLTRQLKQAGTSATQSLLTSTSSSKRL